MPSAKSGPEKVPAKSFGNSKLSTTHSRYIADTPATKPIAISKKRVAPTAGEKAVPQIRHIAKVEMALGKKSSATQSGYARIENCFVNQMATNAASALAIAPCVTNLVEVLIEGG